MDLIQRMVVMSLLLLAACGEEDQTGPTASDFLGAWTGTYMLTGPESAADVPFRLVGGTAASDSGVVAGNLESEYVTGAFAGTLDESGVVVGQIEDEVDGTQWNATLERSGDDLQLELSKEGASITGMGSPSAPANGINWKTTVTNKTDEPLTFVFRVAKFKVELDDIVTIGPGETYVDETGAYCPLGFSASYDNVKKTDCQVWCNNSGPSTPGGPSCQTGECTSVSLFPDAPDLSADDVPDTNCWGKLKDVSTFFWPCCRSKSWEIRKVPVVLDGYDYPYSFTKL